VQSFLSFIRDPIYNEKIKEFEMKKFLFLLFFYFVLMIPTGLVLFFLMEIINLTHKAINLSLKEKILYGILLSPIIEEILFRLILVFNKRNIFILILAALGLLVNFATKGAIVKTVLFVLLIVCLIIVYKYEDKCKSYFQTNFKMFFFLIAGLFAFLHFFNFLDISLYDFFYLPLFVIPQFILGIILGYIRITYGFKYSVFFHAMVNCFIII
jgi:hypothetical protein